MRRITRLPYAAAVPHPLPLFGLNVPLVPGLMLPLHVFEPRYRRLVELLLAEPDEQAREFGLVSVREGHDPAVEGIDALFPVGTSALLRQADRLEDGRFDIVTSGYRRFRLRSVDTSDPLLHGDVDWLDDVTGPSDEAIAPLVTAAFADYRAALAIRLAGVSDGSDEVPSDPTILSYLVTAAMVLSADERQRLLAAESTHARLVDALRLLRLETAIIDEFGCVPALELPGPSPSAN